MNTKYTIAIAVTALIAAGSVASAAPCAVGTTTNSQGQKASQDKSSNADTSTKNLAGGEKAGSPKTVGAMNNVGAETKPGPNEKKPAPGQVVKGQGSNDC